MNGIYSYVPETNTVSTVYSDTAVLYLQSVLHVMLFDILLLLLSSSRQLSPLCTVFTAMYLKQTLFLQYILLQLFCIYSLCYM